MVLRKKCEIPKVRVRLYVATSKVRHFLFLFLLLLFLNSRAGFRSISINLGMLRTHLYKIPPILFPPFSFFSASLSPACVYLRFL
ncbi:hypothetical protein F4703DRAFT_1822329 [Phycomyces blakesleeanus]